jgi:DNA helicase HerA-like ATPase
MGAITAEERAAVRARSPVGAKYDRAVNRESAYEMLSKRAPAESAPPARPARGTPERESAPSGGKTEPAASGGGGLGELMWGTKRRQGMVETLAKQTARTVGSEIGRQILRGVLGGILGGSRRR